MGPAACTEPQCLYKGDLYHFTFTFTFTFTVLENLKYREDVKKTWESIKEDVSFSAKYSLCLVIQSNSCTIYTLKHKHFDI